MLKKPMNKNVPDIDKVIKKGVDIFVSSLNGNLLACICQLDFITPKHKRETQKINKLKLLSQKPRNMYLVVLVLTDKPW